MSQSKDTAGSIVAVVFYLSAFAVWKLIRSWRKRTTATALGLKPDSEGRAVRALNRIFAVGGPNFTRESVLIGSENGFQTALACRSGKEGWTAIGRRPQRSSVWSPKTESTCLTLICGDVVEAGIRSRTRRSSSQPITRSSLPIFRSTPMLPA
jgi:hypothetical protein